MTHSVDLIFPVYKNEESLPSLFLAIQSLFLDFDESFKIQLVFVVDGSPDDCSALIREFSDQTGSRYKINLIELSKNFGQINAILCGLSHSNSDCSIVISADMQDDFGLVKEMLASHVSGSEIVICHRASREDSTMSKLTSKMAYSMIRRQLVNTPQGGFDYFLLGSKARGSLLNLRGRFSFLQADILRLGYPTAFLAYKRKNRESGKSSYTFGMRLQLFFDAMFDISFHPIRFMTKIGIVISSGGFFLSIYSLLGWIKGSSPFQGFTAILCSVLIIGGFVILMLGAIGEYIWRIYDIARNRPQYIVDLFEEL